MATAAEGEQPAQPAGSMGKGERGECLPRIDAREEGRRRRRGKERQPERGDEKRKLGAASPRVSKYAPTNERTNER